MGGKRDCPICGGGADRAYRPFCSKRCTDLDLGRWLSGHYRIAAVEAPDEYELEAEFANLRQPGGEEAEGAI